MRCIRCGAEWPDTYRFCMSCGASLAPAPAEPAPEPEPEPDAEATAAPEPVPEPEPEPAPNAEAIVAPVPEPEPEPGAEATVAPEPEPDAEAIVTPEPVPIPDAEVTISITDPEATVVPPRPVQPAATAGASASPGMLNCTACGAQWPANSKFCMRCGKPLGTATAAPIPNIPPRPVAPPATPIPVAPPAKPAKQNKQRKTGKLIAIIAACIAVAALGVCAILFLPNLIAYNEAEELLAAQDYEGALSVYSELALEGDEGYRDSVDKAELCHNNIDYIFAAELLAQKKYEAAYNAFTALGDFSDSSAQAKLSFNNLNYQNATAALEAGDYVSAQGQFAFVDPTFLDTAELMKLCEGHIALAAFMSWLPSKYHADESLIELDAIGLDDLDDMKLLKQAFALINERGAGYGEAAELIRAHIEDHPDCGEGCYIVAGDWEEMYLELWRYWIDESDVDEQLAVLYGKLLFTPRVSLSPVEVGRRMPAAINLPLDAVYPLLGTAPNGKILVLYDEDNWYDDQDGQDILYDVMNLMPEVLFPTNLAEVQYVINIQHGYSGDGNYRNGTRGVREFVKVTLVEYPSGKVLENFGTVKGEHSPQTITYYGEPPEYYTGGDPDNEAVRELVYDAICLAWTMD